MQRANHSSSVVLAHSFPSIETAPTKSRAISFPLDSVSTVFGVRLLVVWYSVPDTRTCTTCELCVVCLNNHHNNSQPASRRATWKCPYSLCRHQHTAHDALIGVPRMCTGGRAAAREGHGQTHGAKGARLPWPYVCGADGFCVVGRCACMCLFHLSERLWARAQSG